MNTEVSTLKPQDVGASRDRQDYLRTYIGSRGLRADVWRWTAASEFGASAAISFSASGFDLQTGMTAADMRRLASALQRCADDLDAEQSAQQVVA